MPGEATTSNNEISTYLTVTKEGLSVLVIDRLRPELTDMRRALAGDPRIRLFEAVRQTNSAPPPGEADLFQFDKQAYDVIIIGDVSAERLRSASPTALEKIEEMVREKGVGLLMTGGADSLGRDWQGTKVADALPVVLDGTQSEELIPFVPAGDWPSEYMLRLAPNAKDSEMLWSRLNDPLNRCLLLGFTRLGRPKDGATILARANNAKDGAPDLRAANVRQRPNRCLGRGFDLSMADAGAAEIDRRRRTAREILEAIGRLPGSTGKSRRRCVGAAGHAPSRGRR